MDWFLTNMQIFASQDINWWTEVVCIIVMFYRLSFWRHPFTAEHPLVSEWCNATFLQMQNYKCKKKKKSETQWQIWTQNNWIFLISIENKCLYDAIRDLKREKKKFVKRRVWTRVDSVIRYPGARFTNCAAGVTVLYRLCLFVIPPVLIDRCLVQSAVSNLFPNQWRRLKLYLPVFCLNCCCVFYGSSKRPCIIIIFLSCFLVITT